ncbi:glycosyltransferase family 39 protein [Sphingomonas canadensis]|uniref:Glycosyltransferase family 39 protein n=1 Tax=Sphingomonas canadensis TaxID=1219257 RepID=A0ABW3H6W0_9SPHN|nr:glycosyltransferase family 39 protein [Sphingomonas canadensis]MCW3836837.1 glycosyltransferase family 39 protein [Sphingomonas canadensis]
MSPRARLWGAIGGLALLGLALRLAAAQGALWLDEAWSAAMAIDAGTPMGVLLGINHDNNHHLNSLWLQIAGPGASPMLQRALSIACGTAAIPLAAVIALRHSRAAAVLAALLFAISPLLVTYGAEARGYAPMLLALLAAVLIVARWLDDSARPVPWIALGLIVLLGMLAQLTMVFGLAAMAMWVLWCLCRDGVNAAALKTAARVLVPLALPAVAVVAMVFGAAHARGGGLQMGNLEPFSFGSWFDGVGAMLLAALGGPLALIAGLLLLAPADTPEARPGPRRDLRFLLLALAIPLGVAAIRAANSGAPRYHLIAGAAALMLIAIRTGPRLMPGHPFRWPARVLMLLVTVASLITDLRMVRNLRADPGKALEAIAAAASGGAQAAVEHPRSAPVLRMAAAARRYPLELVEAPCPPARFLFLDRDGDQPFPDSPARCGARYHVVAEGHPTGLSGTHWKLYERDAAGAR